MKINGIEDMNLFTDDFLNGLAEDLVNSREQLFCLEGSKNTPDIGLSRINIIGLHRIILELMLKYNIGSKVAYKFSVHFTDAQKNIVWINKRTLNKSKKIKPSAVMKYFTSRISPAKANGNKLIVNNKSFLQFGRMQTENKIIDLINNYLMAL